MEISIDRLLGEMVKYQASDLHLSAEHPPIMRVKGKLKRMNDYPKLTPEVLEKLLIKILNGMQNERLFVDKEIDFSYSLGDAARFRGHIFVEMRSLGAVFRMIPNVPKTIEELGVPIILKELGMRPRGLILVTGPSGSGKTTTLAATIDFLNTARNSHIVTVEDPIEYVFQSRSCLIRQREVGLHTNTFAKALKAVLRQDPDIIMVGEMRDREAMETVLEAAETGHLVFSTLHTNNAPDSIFRILSTFPTSQSQQIRTQLSSILQGIASQTLLPHKTIENKQVLATEVLISTPAISNLIREGNIHMIRNMIETGTEFGMHTLDQDLKDKLDNNIISLDIALSYCLDVKNFRHLCGLDSFETSSRFFMGPSDGLPADSAPPQRPRPQPGGHGGPPNAPGIKVPARKGSFRTDSGRGDIDF